MPRRLLRPTADQAAQSSSSSRNAATAALNWADPTTGGSALFFPALAVKVAACYLCVRLHWAIGENAVNVLLAAEAGGLCDTVTRVARGLAARTVVAPWTDPAQPIRATRAGPTPDLLLLSAQLYGPATADAVAGCVSAFAPAPVVVVGDDGDAGLVEAVFSAGAAGFLPEGYSPSMMASVLKLVLDGATYRPAPAHREPAPVAAPPKIDDGGDHPYGLTERQMEVLGLVAQGKTNHAVALQLGIAEGTVKLHMNAIFKALNVANRSEAILVASRLPGLRKLQIRQAEAGALDLEWLLPHMTHRRLTRGTRIFSQGDPGRELYYLQRGSVRLPEIDSTIGAGELFGEIGIFSPTHRRTCSALCETDVDLFTLSDDQVKQIYYLNPHFAFYVVNLIAKRLMADRERMV
jgi:two-component system, NarL family, nitrate/nitrite response regulator NarL